MAMKESAGGTVEGREIGSSLMDYVCDMHVTAWWFYSGQLYYCSSLRVLFVVFSDDGLRSSRGVMTDVMTVT